jgi:urease accessory protein
MLPVPTAVQEGKVRGTGRLQPVDGALHLCFRAVERRGQPWTVVDTVAHRPPLQIVRPFRLPDGGALVHLHNLSGGVLGGDRLSTVVEVGAGARAQITTTGATRVYRRRGECGAAEQELIAHVGPNALLEYLPDPVIPYAGSAYVQRTRFVLAEGAGLFAWDLFAPGREGRGEVFAYEHLAWETRIEIDAGSTPAPIALERASLDPAQRPLTAPARLGPFRTMATLYVCRVGVAHAQWSALERALHEVAMAHAQSSFSWWGASALVAHGVMVRGLAMDGHPLLAALADFWRAAKRALYDEEAIPPRKIH